MPVLEYLRVQSGPYVRGVLNKGQDLEDYRSVLTLECLVLMGR